MKLNSKFLSLLLWVTQFGLSILFPACFFLLSSVWLQQKYDLGAWVVVVLGIFGLLVSFSTARSCIRALRKDAEAAAEQKPPPVSFNDHD